MDDTVVVDFGSDTFKAGWSNSFPSLDEPRAVRPATIYAQQTSVPGTSSAAGQLHNLVHEGHIVHWEGVEKLLDHMVTKQLGWSYEAAARMLVTEALFASKADRETLTQLLFERFQVEGLFLAEQPVLALYSQGRLTGCVVDVGHDKTDVSVVLEGQLVPPSANRCLGGMQLVTQQAQQMLPQLAQSASSPQPLQGSSGTAPGQVPPQIMAGHARQAAVRKAVHAAVRVQEDGHPAGLSSLQEASVVEHELPDGQRLTVQPEQAWALGDLLLNPSPAQVSSTPLPDCLASACASLPDPAARKAAVESLLVCGGGSAVPGMAARLVRELHARLLSTTAPKLLQLPEYMPPHTLACASWMGGAVLAKVVFAQNQHMTKHDYDEMGPAGIHRKCP